MDLIDFPIKDEEFADLVHLNSYGSTKFSMWVDSLIEDGILDKNNKINIIKKSIENL